MITLGQAIRSRGYPPDTTKYIVVALGSSIESHRVISSLEEEGWDIPDESVWVQARTEDGQFEAWGRATCFEAIEEEAHDG